MFVIGVDDIPIIVEHFVIVKIRLTTKVLDHFAQVVLIDNREEGGEFAEVNAAGEQETAFNGIFEGFFKVTGKRSWIGRKNLIITLFLYLI